MSCSFCLFSMSSCLDSVLVSDAGHTPVMPAVSPCAGPAVSPDEAWFSPDQTTAGA